MKSDYIFFFRGNWTDNLSAEELQNATGKFMAWFERLSQEGHVKGGNPLENEGKVVSGKNGRTVSDGPFAESKEAVGGYFLLQAGSLDEAVQLAQQCPSLAYGASVEVRPVADICPAMQRAQQLQTLATA